ncbi:hypothetical protein [Rhizobium sp. LCM 4573]|uniref:hypothetical protein n=1 Tax=Rhizobium sp. LCM 4573 TaxID=1848291 RepID=UPI0008D9D63E|nr:hypothetical protein [Rhizobium sp. LCM 4573]OHV83732.1 hypothetical protein LCM4573_06410 [Rhizobium sp. LCM 4573]
MPTYSEVRLYLDGLWLLVRGDPQGFRFLDISDRGVMRSFWAILWCLPASALSWFWWRSLYLDGMPTGTRLGGVFFFRLAMLEVFNWFVPLILAAVLCLMLGIQRRFPAIVVTVNWLSVPFSYAYGLLSLCVMLLPGLRGGLAVIWLALMLALIVSISRILRMICGPQPLMVAALATALIVPAMLISDILERFLGVYPF